MNKYLVISTLLIIAGQGQAALVRDGVWQVEEGDQLKDILKEVLPEEPLRQKRLRRLVPMINRKVMDGNKLVVGNQLRLPGVKMPKAIDTQDSTKIGRVLLTTGSTLAVSDSGESRSLKRGAVINKGDTIETKGARAQIRFSDGSLLALRPNTEFQVEEYSFSGKQDGSERGIYKLFKGGFRTISGAIGKVNKTSYQIKTPVATIGIRGTHYGVTLCSAGSCADKGLKDGLYGGVVDGSISTTNKKGTSVFDNDEYFLVASLDSLPQELLAPPGIIFDGPDIPRTEQDKDGAEEGPSKKDKALKAIVKLAEQVEESLEPEFENGTDSDTSVTILLEQLGLSATVTSAGELTHPDLPGVAARPGSAMSLSFVAQNDAEAFGVAHDASNSIIHVVNGAATPVDIAGASIKLNEDGTDSIRFLDTTGGTLAESGRFAQAGINWGRWDNVKIGASALVDGKQVDIKTEVPTGVHYVFVDDPMYALTDQAQLDAVINGSNLDGSSSVFVDTVMGNTRPTNLLGNSNVDQDANGAVLVTGTGGSFINLDFDLNLISSLQLVARLQMGGGDASDTYTLNNVGNISFDTMLSPTGVAPLTGTCTGDIDCGNGAGGSGSVSLTGEASFVVGSGGTGPTDYLGIGVNYSGTGTNAATGGNVGVAGAAVFAQPFSQPQL